MIIIGKPFPQDLLVLINQGYKVYFGGDSTRPANGYKFENLKYTFPESSLVSVEVDEDLNVKSFTYSLRNGKEYSCSGEGAKAIDWEF